MKLTHILIPLGLLVEAAGEGLVEHDLSPDIQLELDTNSVLSKRHCLEDTAALLLFLATDFFFGFGLAILFLFCFLFFKGFSLFLIG